MRLNDVALQERVANEAARTFAEDASGRIWIGLVRSGVVASVAGQTMEQWVVRADRALYRAKADGRDCVRWAEREA